MNTHTPFADDLRPLMQPEYQIDGLAQRHNPPSEPAPRSQGTQRGVTPMPTSTGASPSAGGNLAHTPGNDNRFEVLLENSRQLGSVAGQGEDVQIKHLLFVMQAAFEGVIDNTAHKWGTGVDDATKITEAYWKARNKEVIFNAKASNQRKTISTVRQVITLGGWSKGGPGEPIGMVNTAMTKYKNLRKNPDMDKRLVDAANYLIVIARRMKKSDHILDEDELESLAFKPTPELKTVEDILEADRKKYVALREGKHKAGTAGGTNIDNVIKSLTKELKTIAEVKRSHEQAPDDARAAADIAAAADAQARADEKAGGAAPASATA